MTKTVSILILLTAVAIWGANFSVVKVGITNWDEICFLAARFWVATLVFMPFASWKCLFSPSLSVENKAIVAKGTLAGGFLFLAYLLQALALKTATASEAAFLTALFVVFIPFFQFIVYHRLPLKNEIIGSIVALIGVGMLVGLAFATVSKRDGLLIGSALFYALQITVVGTLNVQSRAIDFTLIQLITVALAATVAAFPLLVKNQFRIPSLPVVEAILFTGIFASALAYFLQAYSQRWLTPSQAGVIFTLEPVFAFLTSIIFLKESVQIHKVVGGLIIVLATIICVTPPRRSVEYLSK